MKGIKKAISLLLCLAMLLSIAPLSTASTTAAETIPEGYTAIETPEDLWLIRNDMAGNYILTADIDLTEALSEGGSLYDATNAWLPLGYDSKSPKTFTGILDGNGHTINGLKCTGTYGGIVYLNYGTIKNLTVASGELTVTYGGAICYSNDGTISNCVNNATISSPDSATSASLGGICYCNSASIQGCINYGDVTASNAVGGICASNYKVISDCANYGAISGGNAGGIVGYNRNETAFFDMTNTNLTGVWNTGAVSGTYAGGIVGYTYHELYYDYSYDYSYDFPCDLTVKDAYNIGAINGNTNAGGIIGTSSVNCHYCRYSYSHSYCPDIYLYRCYNAGSISGDTNAGALIGSHSETGKTSTKYLWFYDCFYRNTMTTATNASSYGGEDPVALSDAMMKRQAAFDNFDFEAVWKMGDCTYKYPVLRGFDTHELTHFEAQDATCEQEGIVEHWHCELCDGYFTDAEATQKTTADAVISPKMHQYESVVTPPTCLEGGFTTYTCTVCGESYTDNEVSALGHSYENGVCTVCGDKEPCEHTETKLENASDPTCTKAGYTGDTVCAKCGEMIEEGSKIEATGHSYENGVCTVCGAADPDASNITWTMKDGVLTISGEGAMPDYSYATSTYNPAPWYEKKDSITSVIIEDGITSIGNNAFKGLSAMTEISIPEGVESIGIYAFSGCTALTKVIVPKSVEFIDKGAFASNSIVNLVILNPECEVAFSNWSGAYPSESTTGLGLCDRTLGYTETSIVHSPADYFCNVQWICEDHECYYNLDNSPAHSNTYHACTYVDNGDGTHKLYCHTCNEAMIDSATHIFIDGFCDCGAEAEWHFDETTGVLTINSDNVMQDYAAEFRCIHCSKTVTSFSHNCLSTVYPEISNIFLLTHEPDTPWKAHHSEITGIILAPSVTKIGENAFVGCVRFAWMIALNPDCQFPDVPMQTFDPYGMGVTDFTLCGYEGSTADDFDCYNGALYNYQFIPLPCACPPATLKTEGSKATCSEDGSIRVYCTTCNATVYENVLPAGHRYTSVITKPTCFAGGYTTHTCTICGDTYTDSETSMVGHKYGKIVTAPTCLDSGYTTYTCTFCGESYTDNETAALGHDYQPTVFVGDDGIGYTQYDCSRCDESYRDNYTNSNLKFKQASVTLSSDFSINFYIRDTVLAGFSDPYVVFKKAMYDKNGNIVDYETVEVTEYTRGTSTDGVACHIFQFAGINSAEMGSNVSATLYASKDGIDYTGKTVEYSVVKYATNMLGKTTDAKLRTLLVDLLNYGAQAQTYFGYNTANPANKGLTDAQKAYATTTAPTLTSCRRSVSNAGATVSFKTATLVLENKVTINYYLNLKNYTGSVDDLYAVVTYKDHLGNEWDCRIDSEDFDYKAYAGSNYYVVNFDELNAMQMRTPCTLELFSKTTNERVSNTLYYSIESYAYSMRTSSDTALVSLLDKMMKYGDATAAYFVQ